MPRAVPDRARGKVMPASGTTHCTDSLRNPGSALTDHLHHRCSQPVKFLGVDRKRWRKINRRAKRRDEHALIHKARAQLAKIRNALKLDHPDRTQDPHILDAREATARREATRQHGGDVLDLGYSRLALEQV